VQYILFDIEATCWDGFHSNQIQEIIELAAIRIDRFGSRRDTFQSLIQPELNPQLSFYCRNLTLIDQADVDSAPFFQEVYDDFERWSEVDPDTYFIAWGKFDYEMMEQECSRMFDRSSLIGNYIDFREYYTSMKDIFPKTGLAKALKYEGMEFEGQPHRAMPDTHNMTRLFERYFDYVDIS